MSKKKKVEKNTKAEENSSTEYPADEKVMKAIKVRTRRNVEAIYAALVDMMKLRVEANIVYEEMPQDFRNNFESLTGERFNAQTLIGLCR